MTTTVTSALTPDEWANEDKIRATGRPYPIPSEARHQVAALALYGQSFGFTWDDVRFLRFEAQFARDQHGPLIAESFDFDGLADRIAALLPPEPLR